MAVRSLAALIVTCCLAASATAQAPLDTTVVLDEVTVEADPHAEAVLEAAERLHVLDAAAIDAAGVQDVAALLERRSSLVVKRYGSGGLATASLRGTGAAQTLVLLDGLRVADPQSGQVDFTLLPTVLLEGVEVLHGAASARYGSGGVGGVVRLQTHEPDGRRRVRLTSSAGAFGERRLGGVVTGRLGRVVGMLAAEASRAEGDFRYTDETLLHPEERRREGADRNMTTLFGRVRCCGSTGRTTVAAWFNDAERGLPGLSHTAAEGARQWDRSLRLWGQHRRLTRLGVLEAGARVQTTRLRYRDAAGASDTSRTYSLAGRAELRHVIGTRWLFAGGAQLGHDRAALQDGVGQTRAGTFLHAQGRLGRVQLFPALRWDAFLTTGHAIMVLSPQFGLNVQPLPWPGLRLKAQAGRAFRAPTLAERFWRPGGNPDLQPEHGWSAEAGALLAVGRSDGHRLEAEVTAYSLRLRDQIVWQPSYAGPGLQVWKPYNAARVHTQGIEASLSGRLQLARRLMTEASLLFTHTRAIERSNPEAPSYGHQLRYVPREQLKLHLGVAWRSLYLDLFGRLVGPRPLATDGSHDMPAYQVVDAHLRYRRTVGGVLLSLALGVENVFDADYQVVRLYPMPPRHGRAEMTASTSF